MHRSPEYIDHIVTGDARALIKQLPPDSVDLVLCDPVYWQTEDYEWVANAAYRVLVDGGSLIAQCGTEHRYAAETAMRKSRMTPRPLIIETFSGGMYQMWVHKSVSGWHPFIWMTKGSQKRTGDWVRDLIRGGGRDKRFHAWGDSPSAFIHLIDRLTKEGDVILDPFCGSGTVPACAKMMNRRYVGFEIDSETASNARERLRKTPLPLLVPEPSQIRFNMD